MSYLDAFKINVDLTKRTSEKDETLVLYNDAISLIVFYVFCSSIDLKDFYNALNL